MGVPAIPDSIVLEYTAAFVKKRGSALLELHKKGERMTVKFSVSYCKMLN